MSKHLFSTDYFFICYRTTRFLVGDNLSDGQWHRLRLITNNNEVLVQLDECNDPMIDSSACSRRQLFLSNSNNPFLKLSSNPLYVGGAQSSNDILNHPGQVKIIFGVLVTYREIAFTFAMLLKNINCEEHLVLFIKVTRHVYFLIGKTQLFYCVRISKL